MTKDESKLEFMRQQFKRHELYALYWHARAMTGEVKTRKVYVGVALTDEEKATGLPNERELTDDEKIKDALNKMLRHIHIMNELNDEMGEILFKEMPTDPNYCPEG